MRAEPFATDDLNENAFLGGKVRLLQPIKGYRAGIDPVLLAASVPAKPGQQVLELGCGGGVGMLCLAARVPGLRLSGVERQPAYADLARRNLGLNGLKADIFEADLADLPAALRQMQFDHVFANPPYFDPNARSAARDRGKEAGLSGETALSEWVACAARRLRPGGSFSVIHRPESLPDLLSSMQGFLGSIVLQPLVPRLNRAPSLVICRGIKAGRGAFQMRPALILHDGLAHVRDGENYTDQIRRVLRNGNALDF